MKTKIDNAEVSLRLATLADKKKIFNWMANSNITQEMLGPPKYPDNPIPSWEEFDDDYSNHYFDGTKHRKGRCFIILYKKKEVGQINYNPIDNKTQTTELDIWLSDKKYTGKGIGTQAIKTLCNLLFEKVNCKKILIQPSARNKNAIKAYSKAGFQMVKKIPKNFEMDYCDSVVMVLKK